MGIQIVQFLALTLAHAAGCTIGLPGPASWSSKQGSALPVATLIYIAASARSKYRMPNIANILKLEISRIARKEVRGETQGLKKAVATYRNEIASLKRRAKDLEDQVRQLGKTTAKAKVAPDAEPMAQAVRFSAKALASQRRRLDLSADRLGLLIGVSGQSIYNWEQGTATPHAKHLVAVAALKSLTVRQAAELVEARRK